MKLTDEQGDAVRHAGNTLLVACPGSGKTRTIVAKLLRCIEEVRNTPRRVACITYTNAAVQEIENRLRDYGIDDEKYDVSTIHSFCLNNILGHFWWHVPELREKWSVLPTDSERFGEIVEDLCERHDLRGSEKEAFESLNREPDGTPISSLPHKYVHEFWQRLLSENRIDFCNIVYFSYRLLKEIPSLAHGLACSFAWILIDEFQDTSALQVELLSCIEQYKTTRFFIVGDPFQSIYSFAGARPDLMDEFGSRIGANDDFRLLGNFRSSKLIVKDAEKTCPRTPEMTAVGDAADFKASPRHVHAASAFDGIVGHFLPALDLHKIKVGNAAVLAPQWFGLYPLGRRLREYGVQISGPGARPYKRTHLFAALAEQICAYLDHPVPDRVSRIEKELFILLGTLTGSLDYTVFDYDGRRCVFKMLEEGHRILESAGGAVQWLSSASKSYGELLCEEGFIDAAHVRTLSTSAAEIVREMRSHLEDVANVSVSDLGLFASPEKNLKLLNLHKAKGREFDAVALVDVHDDRIPHYRARNNPARLREARRLFYVGVTRACRVLYYITDDGRSDAEPSRFLTELGH